MFLAPEDRGLVLARPVLWLPDRRIVPTRMAPAPGSPQVPRKPPTVSLISAERTTSTSPSVSCAVGDVIAMFHVVQNTVVPSLQSGFTNVVTGLNNPDGGAAVGGRGSYRIASSTTHNLTLDAGNKWIYVLRNAHASTPIGDSHSNTGVSQTAVIGGLSIAAPGSFVLATVCFATPPNVLIDTPSGFTPTTDASPGNGRWGGYLGPVGGFSAVNAAVGGGSSCRWLALCMEIRAPV